MYKLIVLCLLCLLKFSIDFSQSADIDVRLIDYNVSIGPQYIIDAKFDYFKIPFGYSGRANITLKEDMGNDNRWLCTVYQKRGNVERKIFGLNGKGICSSLNAYLGSTWAMMERIYGNTEPGKCPIKKKIYGNNNYMNVTTKMFPNIANMAPRGIFRLVCEAYDLQNHMRMFGHGHGEVIRIK